MAKPIVTLGMVCTLTALAEPPNYDLAKVQGADAFDGSAAARELLARNGFVVSDPFFKQIFQPYIENSLPVFITTDSAWHTYHVLLEEAVKQLEEMQATRLAQFSRQLHAAAEAQAAGSDPDFADLAAYCSIGLALQDAGHAAKLPAPQQQLLATLRSGVGEVSAAVGFPISAANFRAASFYSSSGALADYFTARQWYATVLFRLSDARETRLALKLALLIEEQPQLAGLWQKLSGPYDRMLGASEDGDAPKYAAAAKKVLGEKPPAGRIAQSLPAIEKELEARLPEAQVNDQLIPPQVYSGFGRAIKGFRLLPPRLLPCAVTFQKTTDPKIAGRQLPSGLDFLVASPTLRSAAALRALGQAEGQSVLRAVQAVNCEPFPESLHGEAMRLLGQLQKPLPAQAPPALRTEAWADHQLWSQLGAWAEQRHTWALHTKLSTMFLGATEQPAGIVSPYPDFFAGLAQLTRKTLVVLEQAGCEPEFEARTVARQMLEQVELAKRFFRSMKPGARREEFNPAELENQMERLNQLFKFLESYPPKSQDDVKGRDTMDQRLETAKALALRAAETNQVAADDLAALQSFHGARTTPLSLMRDLPAVCDRLAALAQKQLAGESLADADNEWIRDYGPTLARLHFYEGNSYLDPKDDFPLVARVFVNPASGEIVYAGLARPQSLYVVVSQNGKLQLYQGAVMAYREFSRSASEPLDDAGWRKLISEGGTPPPPAFTKSFYAEGANTDVLHALQRSSRPARGDDLQQLLEQLRSRARPEDVTNLLDLLPTLAAQNNYEAVKAVAETVARLPWQPLQTRLFDWLAQSNPPAANLEESYGSFRGPISTAEIAAFILSQHPDQIDQTKFASGFASCPPRARRYCCVILSKLPQPSAASRAALLDATRDADAGVRWQAALAIYQGGLKDAEFANALITRLGDTNEYVGGAAAYALGKLRVQEATPRIRAQLQALNPAQGLSREETSRQAEAVQGKFDGDLFGVFDLLNVDRLFIMPGSGQMPEYRRALRLLSPTMSFPDGVGDFSRPGALLGALAELGGESDGEEMARWLGSPCHHAAAAGLRKIDPQRFEARLLKAALDRNADMTLRLDCLTSLAELECKGAAKALAPLLEETGLAVPMPKRPEFGVRVCDCAAAVIARLQEWEVGRMILTDLPQREAMLNKARAWVKQ